MSEITKEQIAGIKEAMAKAIRLCERLANSLKKKKALEGWEKTALVEHNDIITACNKSRWVLDCLPAVPIIDLEPAQTELLPPSPPASVVESTTVCCDHCLEETTNQIKVGDEYLCVVCNNEREAAEAKIKFEAEEKERQEAIQHKLARVAELQAKKDKRSSEMSLANKQTLADLKEQVKLLESIGRRNLDQKGKQQLTRFKHRIADLETDSVSTGGPPTQLSV
jgi:hypothetical protein